MTAMATRTRTKKKRAPAKKSPSPAPSDSPELEAALASRRTELERHFAVDYHVTIDLVSEGFDNLAEALGRYRQLRKTHPGVTITAMQFAEIYAGIFIEGVHVGWQSETGPRVSACDLRARYNQHFDHELRKVRDSFEGAK